MNGPICQVEANIQWMFVKLHLFYPHSLFKTTWSCFKKVAVESNKSIVCFNDSYFEGWWNLKSIEVDEAPAAFLLLF